MAMSVREARERAEEAMENIDGDGYAQHRRVKWALSALLGALDREEAERPRAVKAGEPDCSCRHCIESKLASGFDETEGTEEGP